MKLLPCPFVPDGLQGPRGSLGPEDPFDGSSFKGLIPDRVLNRLVDILTLVVLLHPQDVSGVEPAVSGMSLGQSFQKLLRRLSQFQKSFSDRLQTVASLFGLKVIRVFHPFAKPCGISLMPGDEFNLGGVDQDLVLRCLEAQDIGDVAGRNGVVVCLKFDVPIWPADPQRHFGAVIGMKR